jgi:preprotein translocase subunit YajC
MTLVIAPVAPALLLLQSSGGGLGPSALFIQLGLIMAIFYFLLIRPQQKQRKQHEESLNALKKGDEIVTSGGIVGRVIRIEETFVDGQAKRTQEDRITIESGQSRLVVERGRIARIVGGTAAPVNQ